MCLFFCFPFLINSSIVTMSVKNGLEVFRSKKFDDENVEVGLINSRGGDEVRI